MVSKSAHRQIGFDLRHSSLPKKQADQPENEVVGKSTTASAETVSPEPSRTAAVNEVLPLDTLTDDEVDRRMSKIEEILGHTAMRLLDKSALAAEWVRHAEAKMSVSGQIVRKPQGGRPESGIALAARKLPVPGQSPEARRKYIERALKIDSIWPEAKAAARTAGLDDNQSALLTIAGERSPEKQLARVNELAERKAQSRGKRKAGDTERDSATEAKDSVSTIELIAPEALSSEQEAGLAALKASWIDGGTLKRDEWQKSDRPVQRRFARDILFTEVAP
jgi:hypothetical protein